jgi:hypothetical protein
MVYYLFIYFLFLHLAVPQGTAEPRLGITDVAYKQEVTGHGW